MQKEFTYLIWVWELEKSMIEPSNYGVMREHMECNMARKKVCKYLDHLWTWKRTLKYKGGYGERFVINVIGEPRLSPEHEGT